MSYSQNPTVFAQPTNNAAPAATKQRVALGNLTNAAKPGVVTRSKAREAALKPVAAAKKAPVVFVEEPAKVVVAQPAAEQSLAAEVGKICLEPGPSAHDMMAKCDPQEVSPYIQDIMCYFSRTEAKYMPSPSYLEHIQHGLDARARATLIDWVVNVHRKFKLMAPVLPLSVNIIDRYLSEVNVPKDRLQLVGASALLIASKFEEIYPPEIEDFVHISDRAFKKEQVIRMEGEILNTLKFNISVPTVFVFMSRFVKIAQADEDVTNLAAYIADAALLEYSMLKYLPSVLSTSSIVLAQKILSRGSWTPDMQAHTGYTKHALTPCITDLQEIVSKGYHKKMTCLTKKYNDPKYEAAISKVSDSW